MKKLKKALFSLSTLAVVSTPIATVISCGKSNLNMHKILPTYTAQADQMIALGIKADYYPLQLDQNAPFDYLLNPSQFLEVQDDDFKNKFSAKIKSLIPSEKGTSWWNQQALSDGDRGSNPEYWQHQGGDLVLYEHYLLDDGQKVVDNSTAPKHYNTPRNYIETNFRISRDPFTRLPEEVMQALLDQSEYDKASNKIKEIVNKLLDVARDIEGTSNAKSVDGKPMPSGHPTRQATDEESWIYNDYIFGKAFHNQFLDNNEFNNSKTKDWLLNYKGSKNWIFDSNKTNDSLLAKLFYASTFQETEKDLGLAKLAQNNYTAISSDAINETETYMNTIDSMVLKHHPVYEQQTEIGGAPMFEGAQRDNILYFYNTAAKLTKAFDGLDAAIKSAKDSEKDGFKALNNAAPTGSHNRTMLENAKANADKISDELRTRMSAIKTIVNKFNNPTYGIVTIAPGHGSTTVQSSSKYSFVYNELGFKQPIPTNLAEMTKDEKAVTVNTPSSEAPTGTLFNMDDNGWWWNLGSPAEEGDAFATTLAERTEKFKSQFDFGIVTANPTQWDNMKNDNKDKIKKMFKCTNIDLNKLIVDYNMWNEGLKTPFVIHMILDHIVKQLQTSDKSKATDAEWKAASNWGEYFTKDFIKD